jgi:hypothetical protein
MDQKRWEGGAWTGFMWLRIGNGGGFCECDNEFLDAIKCGEILY